MQLAANGQRLERSFGRMEDADRLISELEEREQTIVMLRKQLQQASYSMASIRQSISVDLLSSGDDLLMGRRESMHLISPTGSTPRAMIDSIDVSLNRTNRVSMSISSSSAGGGGIRRRSSSIRLNRRVRRSVHRKKLVSASKCEWIDVSEEEDVYETLQSTEEDVVIAEDCTAATFGCIKLYSLDQLMELADCVRSGMETLDEEIDVDHLERHLTEESLLEDLSISMDLLDEMDPAVIEEKKYVHLITRSQFLFHCGL